MIPYTSRIPVASSYVQAIGQVVYNLATVEWNMVYLGSLVVPSFVSRAGGAAFEAVASDFSLLSEVGTHPEFRDLSAKFTDAVMRQKDLLRSTPYTADEGVQQLGGAAGPWPEEKIWAFAKELEDLDIATNALYYKLKP